MADESVGCSAVLLVVSKVSYWAGQWAVSLVGSSVARRVFESVASSVAPWVELTAAETAS